MRSSFLGNVRHGLRDRWISMRWKNLLIILPVLFLFGALSTLHGWFQSHDVKGWWPVILFWECLVAGLYAVAYLFLVKDSRLNRPAFLILYHTVLGAIRLLVIYLFYLMDAAWIITHKPGMWLSLLEGTVHSGLAPYTAYGVFLLAAATVSFTRERDCRT